MKCSLKPIPRPQACLRRLPFLLGFGLAVAGAALAVLVHARTTRAADDGGTPLDRNLRRVLREAGFTGRIEATLEHRLGRPIDPALVELGRLLFFDKVIGLHDDN
jgi:hypothetical protein